MTLKHQSILISFGSFIFLIVVIGVMLYGRVLSDFQIIENQRVERTQKSLQFALLDKYKQLNTKLTDWAMWDDTYTFIEDKNKEYIGSNLTQETFVKLGVDEVLFIDKNGALVESFFVKGTRPETHFPQDLYVFFATGSALINTHDVHKNGVLKTDDGLLMFSAESILKSDGTGPARGFMVFAKYIDSNTITSLTELTQSNVTFTKWDSGSQKEFKNGITQFIKPLNATTISCYSILFDVFNTPQGVLRIDTDRDITSQGSRNMQTLMIILTVSGILTAAINYWLMNGVVLRGILSISEEMKEIGDVSSPKKRLSLNKGNNEIDALRVNINNTLDESNRFEDALKKEKENVEEKIELRTRELAEEKARFMSSIASLPQAFIIVNTNNEIVVYNKRLTAVLGRGDGIWTLKKVNDSLGTSINLEEEVAKVMKNKTIVQSKEVRVGSKYLTIFIAPVMPGVYAETNDVIGSIITISDITEERLLTRSKDEFFSIASHELRTPLTIMRGNTSMILEHYKKELENPNLRSMIMDMHTASIRLISIVNDFLNVSRLEQGKMEYVCELITPYDIVQKINTNLMFSAQEKEIKLINMIDKFTTVWADEGKTEQILLNLIGNSLKFTKHGTITISAANEPEMMRIDVSDTGSGIPLANQSLLFHKFQQAASSTVTRDTSQGTGLGLYISRLMATGMKGTVELVQSDEGKGSTFRLTLPTHQ